MPALFLTRALLSSRLPCATWLLLPRLDAAAVSSSTVNIVSVRGLNFQIKNKSAQVHGSEVALPVSSGRALGSTDRIWVTSSQLQRPSPASSMPCQAPPGVWSSGTPGLEGRTPGRLQVHPISGQRGPETRGPTALFALPGVPAPVQQTPCRHALLFTMVSSFLRVFFSATWSD